MESTGKTKFGRAFGRSEWVVGRKRSAFTQLPRRRLHTNTDFRSGSEVNVQHWFIYLGAFVVFALQISFLSLPKLPFISMLSVGLQMLTKISKGTFQQ